MDLPRAVGERHCHRDRCRSRPVDAEARGAVRFLLPCVRRAFLSGKEGPAGRSPGYRKQWFAADRGAGQARRRTTAAPTRLSAKPIRNTVAPITAPCRGKLKKNPRIDSTSATFAATVAGSPVDARAAAR